DCRQCDFPYRGASMAAEVNLTTAKLAADIRAHAIQMVYRASSSHLGGGLSMADLLAVLYSDILRVDPQKPQDSERDRFILSKGHCCAALYAALAMKGFFPIE